MAATVRLTDEALGDLAAIQIRYAHPGAGRRAAKTIAAIMTAIRNLSEDHQMWPVGPLPETQRHTVAGHAIVYRANYEGPGRTGADIVTVLTIYHPGESRQRPRT